MKNVPKTSALAKLRANHFCWEQFEKECQKRGPITMAFFMASRGQANQIVVGRFTAFELIEPEAQAWLGYFRGIGAIATAPAGESEPVRKNQQTQDI